ncbi:flagellar basal-body MS-ring/collar protein FliF [Erythrobacter dokdonensis]|uniref:Flagellar M-ring protein n=1 Tax=Erythrobacter dokdonensis DSW-74 TaxID=1300349 RepID=A0A1A7BEE7_9SPHN|nr:flagellar basal-body MS-ring/collar protein FliF [Erythrobacter dokdonensis]OBV10908.1 Flagellar M-Ring protein [Erythrobacter dokdonensis DSW-74]
MADSALPAAADPAGLPSAPPQAAWRTLLPDPVAGFIAQPALSRALPALAGVGALAAAGALWVAISSGPDRVLYTSLSDAERAKVVEALDAGGIAYAIDNQTGALSVAQDDVYRARMLVASDAGIAAPEDASAMLDAMPLGTSRTLEGERLRLARERELMLTIREIDGIESVRVHLATPERSVFVRENNPPSASVMLRLVNGRSLSQSQVEAIVNLVAASVPGMNADAVRVVDQNGRLLSSPRENRLDALLLQREHEAKLREQIDALLMPLLGEGNFSAQVQAELDQNEVTSARETYEKEGVVRNESERNATRTGAAPVGGVPGVPANTPPPDAELVDGPPQPPQPRADAATDTESAVQRNYELGREVAVTSTRPGGLVKLSVAVAVSDEALKAAAPMTAAQLEALVGAAVGANAARGDRVEVVASKFETVSLEPPAFYEAPWFAMLVRYGTALLAVLLVLLLAVRPLIGKLRGRGKADAVATPGPDGTLLTADRGEDTVSAADAMPDGMPLAAMSASAPPGELAQQVERARLLAASQPERAVEALQRMLAAADDEGPEAQAT